MRFTVLGPVSLTIAGRQQVLRRAQPRAVLGYLLLNAGRVVPAEMLVEALWGGAEPATARNRVQSAVSAIRGQLRAAGATTALRSGASGYLLDVEPDQFDLWTFEHALRTARELARSGSDDEACRLIRAGLALWQGPALGGCVGAYVEAARLWLTDMRLAATEDLIDLEIARGSHDQVAVEFMPLVDAHPLRERLRAQLMRALYLGGRQVEALALLHDLRQLLNEGHGIDPSPALRDLEQAILRGSLDVPTQSWQTRFRGQPNVPAQLPLAALGFTGRTRELDRLDELLVHLGDQPTSVVVSALSGTAGVGKSALAVHWAHRAADRFPDGQLYVNLRGFDPSGTPLDPTEALRGFLEALGVPLQHVPVDLDVLVARYRSLMAGRRMLVLLDNARNAEHVRPLLPGAPGSLVVVTSRDQLVGLLVGEGARPVTLDLMTAGEARDLLAARVGAERIAAEPDAVEQIVTWCARLPLALTVVAARAAARPDFPLSRLAGQLHDVGSRLEALAETDSASNVRAVFSWSYQELSSSAARLFRLFALTPQPIIGMIAAASLAGASADQVRALLAELTGAHLLTEYSPGRFGCHDLLRAYATELNAALDSKPDRRAALLRLLDHYLHTAHAAALLHDPTREGVTIPAPQPGATPEIVADRPQALARLATRLPELLAAITTAAGSGLDVHACRLAWAVWGFLHVGGRHQEIVTSHTVALAAAQRIADRSAQAHMHRSLASAYAHLGHTVSAEMHLRESLDLGDSLGEVERARGHMAGAFIADQLGDYRAALDHAEQATRLYQRAGHPGQAHALTAAGWCHARLGHHQQAIHHCQQALRLHGQAGNHRMQGRTLDSLGYAHRQLGNHTRAAICYRHAVELFEFLGDRYPQAQTLDHLADAYHDAGDLEAANTALQGALTILDELHHPDADTIRGKLTAATRSTTNHR